MGNKMKMIRLRTKIGIFLVILFLITPAVISVVPVNRTISSTHDNIDTFIRNSNGKYWSVTWANIQTAIDDVNGSGTIYIPNGTISGSTTIEINEEVNLIGIGHGNLDTGGGYGSRLTFTGTGDAIHVDGDNNYVVGCRISGLYIYASNQTAINISASSSNVVTLSSFDHLYLDNVSTGIKINCTSTVYRNNFEHIGINNVADFGIYATGGAYNMFYDIDIEAVETGYGIYIGANAENFCFKSVDCDGVIRSDSVSDDWEDIVMEGIHCIDSGLGNPPTTNTAFRMVGGGRIDGLCFTEVNLTYGLTIHSSAQFDISNINARGTEYPDYIVYPSTETYGILSNVHGSSASWSHLDTFIDWTFLEVNGRNWFANGTTRMSPYYMQASAPTLTENTTAWWYNTNGGWLYQVCNAYGTQFYLNMSTTY